MIIVTDGISKKHFFYYFLEILLNDLELVFLEFNHFYKTQRTNLFSFYLLIFTHCVIIIICINALHLSHFFTACKHHSLQKGTKSHLKCQFPPEITLLKSQQNFQTCLKIRFPVHSHLKYKLQKVFKMNGV